MDHAHVCKIATGTHSTVSIEMEEFADLELVPVLYNTCYGGFTFSDAFMERLNERHVSAGMEKVDDYIIAPKSCRSDPMLTTLFQEMGSAASSGDFSKIAIKWIPKEFIDSVEFSDYDGRERVYVDDTGIYTKLLQKFLSEWRENPELTVKDLDERYTRVDGKVKRYNQFQHREYKQKSIYGAAPDSE